MCSILSFNAKLADHAPAFGAEANTRVWDTQHHFQMTFAVERWPIFGRSSLHWGAIISELLFGFQAMRLLQKFEPTIFITRIYR